MVTGSDPRQRAACWVSVQGTQALNEHLEEVSLNISSPLLSFEAQLSPVVFPHKALSLSPTAEPAAPFSVSSAS